MNVLIPSTSSQEIKIIPRDYTPGSNFTVILIEDGSGKKQTITGVTGILEGNYFKLTVAFTILIANSTYFIEVQNQDGSVIYKGKVFCTTRTDKRYKASLNTGKYSEHTSNTLNQKYIIVDGGSTDEAPIGGGGGGGASDVIICYDEGDMAALTSAFQICNLYCVTINDTTYDDWYLPSKEEAEELYRYLGLLNQVAVQYGYDPYYVPEVVSTPSGPSQTNLYYWTSTERVESPSRAYVYQRWFYNPPISNLTKDIPENCYLSEVNCNGAYYNTKKTRVRPVRFEPGVDGSIQGNLGEKGYGGIVAGAYTLNGVDGALIISPTEPKPEDAYTQWSDLGQVTTGANSETDGPANSAIVLALET